MKSEENTVIGEARRRSGSLQCAPCRAQASLTLARISFPQCPAIWRAKSWHFSGTKSVKTSRWRWRIYSLSHVVPSRELHKLRTVHEILDTQCSVARLTISSWHLGNKFLNISKCLPRMARTTPRAPHRHTSPRSSNVACTLSRVKIPSMARQTACHGACRANVKLG